VTCDGTIRVKASENVCVTFLCSILSFSSVGPTSECGYCMMLKFCESTESTFVGLETFVQPGIFNLSTCKLIKNSRTICDSIGITNCELSTFAHDDLFWAQCEVNNNSKIIITSTKYQPGSIPTTSCLSK